MDNNKLGRWAWTRYQGTFDRFFRVVSIYRPVVGKEYNTAFMQQYRHSLKHSEGKCPKIVDVRLARRDKEMEGTGG